MSLFQTTMLALGIGFASGLNLYAVLFSLGVMSARGSIVLPPALGFVQHPLVILIALILFCIQFCVDKVAGLDAAWNTIHTFIRIPAALFLCAMAFSGLPPAVQVLGTLAGTLTATCSHATKSGARVLINTSPGASSNWIASLSEDLTAFVAIWLAARHRIVFLAMFAIFLFSLIWLAPIISGGLRRIFVTLGGRRRAET